MTTPAVPLASEAKRPDEAVHPRVSLASLEHAIAEKPPRREFLAQIDALRDPIHESLTDAYGDPYFAKLLWLKASNYLFARYQQVCRHVHLVARPVTLMLDPSNSCQLACPGCVHSTNQEFTARMLWPPGVMRPVVFETLLQRIGPFALHAVLYNYGEPLLNKRLPEFIEAAHGHGMGVQLSTNLSVPFDVERFVEAAPEFVILSIDGATQESYARFRRNGNLALVLDNLRRLVAAKRRRGAVRPVLVWRFLTFEHNLHEVEDALALAQEIGVDVFRVGTPFDVSLDEPTIRVATSERRGIHPLQPVAPSPTPALRAALRHHASVEERFEETWETRAAGLPEEPVRPDGKSCTWLYYNQSVDAGGRVIPCCIAPTTRKRLVFGDLAEGDSDPWNSSAYHLARLAFADREAFREARANTDEAPWCAVCPRQPDLTYDPQNGASDLVQLDPQNLLTAGDPGLWWRLAAHWS